MKSRIIDLLHLVTMMMACYLSINMVVVILGEAAESPQYVVVQAEADFEIRLYTECSWMSALVQGTSSFEKSTKDGFHRLYQYIHGGNLNSTELTMTAPVLTSMKQTSSSTSHGAAAPYSVRYYLPAKYEKNPPQPSPELSLQLETWSLRCVAVRKFAGFAEDDNVGREAEALLASLRKHQSTVKAAVILAEGIDVASYTIAQYNSSHHLSGRLNEVWMNVSGSAKGCPGYLGN